MGIDEEIYQVKRLKTVNEYSLNEFLVFRLIGNYLIIISFSNSTQAQTHCCLINGLRILISALKSWEELASFGPATQSPMIDELAPSSTSSLSPRNTHTHTHILNHMSSKLINARLNAFHSHNSIQGLSISTITPTRTALDNWLKITKSFRVDKQCPTQ